MVTVRFEWNAEVGCAAFRIWEWNSCTWRGFEWMELSGLK